MADGPKLDNLFSVDIEQALLGAFLVDNGKIAVARANVRPEDFYDPLHQHLAECCFDLEERGKLVTPLTLQVWGKHHPGFAVVGGLDYLANLAMAAPAMANAPEYAQIVAEYALKRRAHSALTEASDAILAGKEVEASLKPVITAADDIADRHAAKAADLDAFRQGEELLHRISHQAIDEDFAIKTGIAPLDEILGGLYPETLTVIGGRPGMGKSILGANLIRQAALQGVAADWWSIEMPGRECSARLMADEDFDVAAREGWKGLKYEDLVKMRATPATMERAALANRRLADLPISIIAEERVTVGRVAGITRARCAREPKKRRLVVVDHLHIMTPEERYKGNRVYELSEITGGFKRLAKRTGTAVVLLCQLSREIERRDDKRPTMPDFRDSGSIEQDADVVLGVYRPEYYAAQEIRQAKTEEQRTNAETRARQSEKVLEIPVLKQRSGATKDDIQCFIDIRAGAIRSEHPLADGAQTGLALNQLA